MCELYRYQNAQYNDKQTDTVATYDAQVSVRLQLCSVLHPCSQYLAVTQIAVIAVTGKPVIIKKSSLFHHYYTPTWIHSPLVEPVSRDVMLLCNSIVFTTVSFVCGVFVYVRMYTCIIVQYKPTKFVSDVWLTVHRNSVWIRKTN